MPEPRTQISFLASEEERDQLARIAQHHKRSRGSALRYLMAQEIRRIEDIEAARPSARKPRKTGPTAE